ncbi:MULTISPECIES: hypothetical protein [Planktothricoides]|uniref:Uncharacterized protein n=1 Tax=Planktothricoides raciborskii FACHB-1370 TaxID=2949576 RepID=A0ABR8EQS0_9CYAN|nr:MULTISPECIES: hypothetical protein [Planktothricoides]MBD2547922.1 hypothetical protein [Planktothricoides raciborskii FACHB-1370]MBD2586338.1 hypothetical protein [Planktothricoides raciborskii FACHB-1261]
MLQKTWDSILVFLVFLLFLLVVRSRFGVADAISLCSYSETTLSKIHIARFF